MTIDQLYSALREMGVSVDLADATRDAARALTPKQRRILVLWAQGYDCREIAERERCAPVEVARIKRELITNARESVVIG